ncbi:tryptophanase [Clostridium tetanomorphum]|uniref:Tryptophanase n=1 Tax=Clostridium tetanomorphum TaxID=1553 RepID=A0A923J112_CLOTT|nr:tryptophanase [Clostridium tetanomorphum]KAJ52612.1 tryptophanase/L-cysteine desulfhydrase, PLP-dependent [Clostridium tetanomorphum DSM 665]MBC2396833.1 tryptophanase [Clostridium tetanomorphum]MBP1863205.1 tryptophanase [Clostridium tetanomorphum]NRS84313.1 tryptophanase [Clostridium tetanomorphum]NRZ97527.1 tryptophanase [Clostridium tetanomorphum]
MNIKYVPEPFRIKMVETIKMLNREERDQKIAEAKYNLFSLKGEDVYIDLLTDSGTNAMSQDQWAGVMRGDEAYAGASSYFKLVEAAQDIFGYKYIQPVHQGRAAEKVLFGLLMGKGQYSISNMHFDTTRAHVELTGARAIDCVVPEAADPSLRIPFKGNMDTKKLEELIKEHGADKIGLVIMTITNNSAGGQPVSVQNIKETSKICKKYNIKLCIDAARYAENAYLIKQREPGYENKSIKEIVREVFSYADMFTMSAKKDTIVNMGGLIGIKEDAELYQLCKGRTISFEGFVTYGGLSGRDLEALAIGLYEGIDENYLRYRIGQMEYLASRLDEAGIAYQSPVGGHGVFVDAKAMFPHIPYYEFPGQALAVELYKEAGIRTCDIGSYMLGNDPDTGKQLHAEFEFTRLAIPRRVYTQAHIDIMADALISIKERASAVKGYRITWEPKVLRHFQASLEPVK